MAEEEKAPPEKIRGKRPGDVIVRRKRREKQPLRSVPSIPEFVRFMGDLATQTPLVPIILAFIILLFIFASVLFAVENDAVGEHSIDSFGDALFWCISSAQTMGASDPLLYTTAGKVIGSIWAVLSTIMFFGAIIAGMTAYFVMPRKRPSKQIVATLQYNLERLDDLSVSELEILKQSMDTVLSNQIDRMKSKEVSTQKAWSDLGKIKENGKE
ncbi:MAG: two pore domain potassium channel family protein [Chloroflexi bacterium]|jgi:voltage-gated potassium channel|nr:two pore domain potassium channel family protein [Chloroflexota bacterium]